MWRPGRLRRSGEKTLLMILVSLLTPSYSGVHGARSRGAESLERRAWRRELDLEESSGDGELVEINCLLVSYVLIYS